MREQIHILLVEDCPSDRDLWKALFVGQGCDDFMFHETQLGEEALDYLLGNSIDCILLDQNLPDISGLEVLERTKKEFPNIPVIMLTGLEEEGVVQEAMKLGASDYLVKDEINAGLLDRTVRYAIQRAKTDPEDLTVEAFSKISQKALQDLLIQCKKCAEKHENDLDSLEKETLSEVMNQGNQLIQKLDHLLKKAKAKGDYSTVSSPTLK